MVVLFGLKCGNNKLWTPDEMTAYHHSQHQLHQHYTLEAGAKWAHITNLHNCNSEHAWDIIQLHLNINKITNVFSPSLQPPAWAWCFNTVEARRISWWSGICSRGQNFILSLLLFSRSLTRGANCQNIPPLTIFGYINLANQPLKLLKIQELCKNS